MKGLVMDGRRETSACQLINDLERHLINRISGRPAGLVHLHYSHCPARVLGTAALRTPAVLSSARPTKFSSRPPSSHIIIARGLLESRLLAC